ncbi:N-acetylmuramoyl-L-alanine amidase (plasmid) [Halobacillus litoralis]|uniref:N-acetylmuramoyl-L-alanine amidase n=1 Tax=Halobacillus litoralis TaxID=45668 RepID=UPI001CFF290C|nr:N-acetylmuramoyl-L-alanine amidase [Halobacillus litoralis]WLR49600.1 N-acetylmuramoyl-L-alanine amidase [Halobacillus litoralis]
MGKIKVGISIGHGEDTWDTKGSKGIELDNGGHWEEFWFNEKVGKIVYYLLKDHNFEVILPQKWDSNETPLDEKADAFNEAEVDLVVAIHANAGADGAEGACIFHWTGSNAGHYADLWLENFGRLCPEQGFHGNGRHVADWGQWNAFYMLHATDMPTALIEHGFFTTDEQRERLQDPDFQDRSAQAIVKSICDYFTVEYYGHRQTETASTDDSPSIGFVTVEAQELYYYGSADWQDKAGTVEAGEVFTVTDELHVEGYKMYELVSGTYLTANEDYVSFEADESTEDDYVGFVEVEATKLYYYGSADWTDKRGTVNKGDIFTIVETLEVGGGTMYKLKSGTYVTANEDYVTFHEEL